MGVSSYRDLLVWQEGMALAKNCYTLTRCFPKEELFGLTSQIRRSAVSIPANIAEGNGRENTRSYVHFLRIAQGSLKELETHLLLASEVGLCSLGIAQPILDQTDHIGRMIRGLIRALQKKLD
jgi:four helix bundle protein